MSYGERTKGELQDELRDRDLPVSGTKDELIERLEEDDRGGERDADGDENGTSAATGGEVEEGPGDRRLAPREAARRAAQQLSELSGRAVDGIAGFERVDDGWRVLLEVVEVSRVPSSTDVLGAYEVTVDADGELVGYERLRRFVRGQAGGDRE